MRPVLAVVRLSRPLFLYGGVAGVALGAAVAHRAGHGITAATYAWAQGLVTAFQMMVHFANDYFDRETDRLGPRTAWSGGSGVLGGGALAPAFALRAALACAALGTAAILRFALVGNAAVALLGTAILAGAWTYSAPPVRFATRGLGELDATLVVAVLVPGVGYAAFAHAVDATILTAVIPCAFALFAMMLCVEMPDAGSDAIAGKKTLVVRWTPACTYLLLPVIVAASMVTLARIAGHRAVPASGSVAAVALTIGAALIWTVWRGDRRPARVAFLGVLFYAATATSVAAAFALAPGH